MIVKTVESCDADTCFASDESYEFTVAPQGAVTIGYQVEPWAAMHLGLAVVTQPTSTEDFGDPIVIPIVRGGASFAVIERWLELTIDAQWPFYSEVASYGPTLSFGARGTFGSVE